MSNKKKRSQLKLLNEVRDQLVLQAERWGLKGHYTPMCLDEMTLEQSHKITSDLMSEKANLEYELYMMDSNKRDLLIKMERLQKYIKKAFRVIEKYDKNIKKQLNKVIENQDKVETILRGMRKENTISFLISSN
ncbi:MAG: hypothetical protein WCV91_00820 [Candidatus Margulisiibacteriota bacterium]